MITSCNPEPLIRRVWPVITVMMLVAVMMAAGQSDEKNGEPSKETVVKFPESWAGEWKGTCRALSPGGRANEFAMELHIKPTGDGERFTWTIIYGEDERRQERPYELVAVDAAMGHYQVDEKNSIVLDAYLIGETLYSQFSVNEAMINTEYAVREDGLHFDLTSCDFAKPRTTGGDEGIPEVQSYRVQAAQHALLKRAGK